MKWLRDKKAVSPVIGVILMVAITVILAAVIASFVFGLGSKAPKSAPQAQLAVEDNTSVTLSSSTGNQTVFILEHNGGEDIVLSDLKIIVEYASNGTSYDTLTWNTDHFAGSNLVSSTVSNGVFSAGDKINFNEATGKTVNQGTYRVRILHIPSNQFIFDGQVTVQ